MVIALLKQKIGKLKSQLTLKKAFITLLFVVIGATVFAQTGKISGTVSDKKTGETLIGAGVKISGTTKAVATDVDGKYILSGLADGKYTIEVLRCVAACGLAPVVMVNEKVYGHVTAEDVKSILDEYQE